MAKDVDIKMNIYDKEKVEKLMAVALGEIIEYRINKLSLEERKYVLEKILDYSSRE